MAFGSEVAGADQAEVAGEEAGECAAASWVGLVGALAGQQPWQPQGLLQQPGACCGVGVGVGVEAVQRELLARSGEGAWCESWLCALAAVMPAEAPPLGQPLQRAHAPAPPLWQPGR